MAVELAESAARLRVGVATGSEGAVAMAMEVAVWVAARAVRAAVGGVMARMGAALKVAGRAAAATGPI